MKFGKKFILVALIVLVITTLGVIIILSKTVATSKPMKPSNVSAAAVKHSDQSVIVYKDNKSKPLNSFISKNSVLNYVKANIKDVASGKATVKSTELKTWKEYVVQDRKEPGFKCTFISDDHMVWVVKLDCPKGISFQSRFYPSAEEIIVLDSEAEKLLAFSIIPNCKK